MPAYTMRPSSFPHSCARASLMVVEKNVSPAAVRSSSVTDSIHWRRPSSLSILSTTAGLRAALGSGEDPSFAANRGVSGPNGATTGGGLTFSRWYMNPARKSATSMKPRNCDTG